MMSPKPQVHRQGLVKVGRQTALRMVKVGLYEVFQYATAPIYVNSLYYVKQTLLCGFTFANNKPLATPR